MARRCTAAIALFVAVWIVTAASARGGSPAASTAALAGAIRFFDAQTFARIGALNGASPGDEMGTLVDYLAAAPGAAGGGRLYLRDDGIVVSTISAAEMSTEPTARLGESWTNLGHAPGSSNILAVGAPGVPGLVGGAPAPAVVLVNTSGLRFVGELGRVVGTPGSMFGWRIRRADRGEGSYFSSYFVSAPLEGSAGRERAGVVYKYDTVTRTQIWKFEGERADGLAGYDLVSVEDANRDGIRDVLVGAPGTLDARPAGSVYLLSGADGEVLRRLDAPDGARLYGYRVTTARLSAHAVEGIFVSAPGTPRGRREEVGALFFYRDLESEPRTLRGRRRGQWFGVSMELDSTRLFVGSFEGHADPAKDRRGSVTVMLPGGRVLKTLRGRNADDYFGREFTAGGTVMVVGAPGAPPVLLPR